VVSQKSTCGTRLVYHHMRDSTAGCPVGLRCRADARCMLLSGTLRSVVMPKPPSGAADQASASGHAERPRTHLYYAETWGNAVGVGASNTVFAQIGGYAKVPTPGAPFVVINEFVASRLGTAVGLPVPPGCLIGNHAGGDVAWITLSYLPSHRMVPPVDPAVVVKSFPALAAGVVVFDFVIGNTDRHNGNLALVNGPVLTPAGPSQQERLEVFDHSHAVVNNGIHNGVVSPSGYLSANKDQFIIGGNCLLAHIASLDDLMAWGRRVRSRLPDHVIDEVCAEAAMITSSFTASDATALGDFLKVRRDTVEDVLRKHAASFPAVPASDWAAA